MDALFTQNLPTGIRDIFTAPAGTSLAELARLAAAQLTGIQDDVVRSRAGKYVLTFLQGRAENGQREVVSRALDVMEKFPHYPRPRAEIARRALELLAQA